MVAAGLAAVVAGAAVAAVPGDPDSGFGSGGLVTTGIGEHGDDQAAAVAVQPDGKAVVAGRSGTSFAVVRYQADGSRDPSFGGGDGIVTTGFGPDLEARAAAVAIQPDGKIVVAGDALPPFNLGGESPGDFALVRYNADGSLDTGFDGDGRVTTDFDAGSADGISDVAVQTDGGIVAVGSSASERGPSDFAIARYDSSGALDTGFSTDGKQTTDIVGGSLDGARGVAIQPDGAIVVAGSSTDRETFSGAALARYESDGDLDPTFSTDGKLVSDLVHSAGDVALQDGGEIVVVGVTSTFDENDVARDDIAVARYATNGDADTTFGGGDGGVTTDLGANEWANAVAIQPGGEIVVAGLSGSPSFDAVRFGDRPAGDLAVVRYDSTGALDTTFSGDGTVTTDFRMGGGDTANDVAIQPGGQILVAGASHGPAASPHVDGGSTSDFILARYQPGGALDGSFDGDGKVDTTIGDQFGDRAGALAVQDDGKLVVAGSSVDEQGVDDEDFAVARYEADGSLDPTFSGNGELTTDLRGQDLPDRAQAVAIDGDGRIVVAGISAGDFAVARYEPDGDLDLTFGGGDGRTFTDFGGEADEVTAVAIQADGKIVALGGAGEAGMALARYEASGALDQTFGTGGRVTDRALERARGLAIQPVDGAIVVAGGGDGGAGGPAFAIARYDSSGAPDTTFGGDGKVTTDIAGGSDLAADIVVQPDGKILAAGTAGAPDTPIANCGGEPQIDFGLARYEPDGDLDPTFSGDGKLTTDFGGTFDDAHGVAIQPDGAIVAAGHATSDFALARYASNGALDATFSGDGMVTTDFGAGGCDVARDVALADGGILLAGSTSDTEGSRFALARYLRTLAGIEAPLPPLPPVPPLPTAP